MSDSGMKAYPVWQLVLASALLLVAFVVIPGCPEEADDDDDVSGEIPMDDLDIVDMGAFTATDAGGVMVDLVVPAGASSSTVVMQGGGDEILIQWTVLDPDGAQIYTWDDEYASDVRCFPTDDVHTFMHPSSPLEPIREGTYQLEPTSGGGAVDTTLTAIHRMSGSGGLLAVAFHFVGVPGLDATTAPDHANFQIAVDEMDAILSGAGIVIDDITYEDVTTSVDELTIVGSDAGPNSELGRLLAMSGSGMERRLHLFVVQGIDYGGLEVVGQAGSAPGPAVIQGTSHSGIAISAIDLESDPTITGLATAHEIGHYLGLYHTTEKAGDGWDPLDDTPFCGPENDANADGYVAASECSGLGGDNVMFWSPPSGSSDLTANQEYVMVRNPLPY
jgi:hypothetical protein